MCLPLASFFGFKHLGNRDAVKHFLAWSCVLLNSCALSHLHFSILSEIIAFWKDREKGSHSLWLQASCGNWDYTLGYTLGY